MSTIELTEKLFYKAGASGVSQAVGYESSKNRVARYTFTAPADGVRHVTLTFTNTSKQGGSAIGLRFYIGADPASHKNAGASSEYTGALTCNSTHTVFTAQADVTLQPGQTYYLWLFPAEARYGWYEWSCHASMDTEPLGGVPVVPQTAELGQTIPITVESGVEGLTYRLKWQFGAQSGTIADGTWTPPEDLALEIPDAASGTAVITCESWQEGSLFCAAAVELTLTVPAHMVPTAQAILTDTSGAYDAFGTYAAGVSTVQVAMSGEGSYGSTVSSWVGLFDGVSHTGDFTTGVLTGEHTLTVTVTDSRGRTGTASYTLRAAAYTPPALTLNASRCLADGTADDVGEYARVTVTGQISELNSGAGLRLVLAYGTQTEALDCSTGGFTTQTVIPAPSVASLTITAALSDALFTASRSMVLSIGYATMDLLAGGRGISFGTTAAKEGFTCAMDTDMAGHPITGLPEPQTDDAAATKGYVDAARQTVITAVEAGTPIPFSMAEGGLYQLSYITSSKTAADITLKVNGAAPGDHMSSYSAVSATSSYGGGQIARSGTNTFAAFNGFARLMDTQLMVWGTDLRGNGVAGMSTHVWNDITAVESLTISAPGTLILQRL